MKRKYCYIKILMLLSLSASITAGCASAPQQKESPATTTYTKETLVDGIFISNANDEFIIPCAAEGTRTYNRAAELSDVSRIIWYLNGNKPLIPTLSPGGKIIYKNAKSIPDKFYLELFEDMGTTLGIRGISLNNAGKYCITSSSMLYPGSTAQVYLSQYVEMGTLILDNINGEPINETMVNKVGAFSILQPNKKYVLGFYIGTNYYTVPLLSDTQIWVSGRVYQITDYELTTNGYLVLELPPLMPPALYDINGVGYFNWEGYNTES